MDTYRAPQTKWVLDGKFSNLFIYSESRSKYTECFFWCEVTKNDYQENNKTVWVVKSFHSKAGFESITKHTTKFMSKVLSPSTVGKIVKGEVKKYNEQHQTT